MVATEQSHTYLSKQGAESCSFKYVRPFSEKQVLKAQCQKNYLFEVYFILHGKKAYVKDDVKYIFRFSILCGMTVSLHTKIKFSIKGFFIFCVLFTIFQAIWPFAVNTTLIKRLPPTLAVVLKTTLLPIHKKLKCN